MSEIKEELEKETLKEVSCFHCGEICEEIISHDEKNFCCQGCYTVYDILKESGLDNYYELNASPGIKNQVSQTKYDYLENEAIVSQILSFENDSIAKVTFLLPAIHCSSCIWLIENLVRLRPGIKQSSVNFVKKEATVLYEKSTIDLKELVLFLCSLGYEPDIKLKTEKTKETKTNKSLVIKLAVAGFCFGNSMLISLPHYLDSTFLLTSDFKSYFGYINLLMALPVLFYSASDYFKTAYLGLKRGHLGIDVPISLGILTLFLRTLVEVVFETGAGYSDSLCGLVFFLLIGKWYQNKTYQALAFDRDYQSFFPIAVNKFNDDGSKSFVQLKDLQQGDQLLIRNDEVIPADCVLLEGESSVDYSFVTGESVPEKKKSGDKLFAGGRHNGSPVKVTMIQEVSSSYLTSLWNQSELKENDHSRLKLVVDKVSAYFTYIILAIATVTAGYWAFVEPSLIWNTVTSVLIVACPCALALAVPFTYGHTLRVFGNRGFFLKNADVIEKLAKIRTIIFDKTGTITTTSKNSAQWHGPTLSTHERELVKSACWGSIHPLSRMISQKFYDQEVLELSYFEEITGKGIIAHFGNDIIKIGSKKHVCEDTETSQETRVYVSLNTKFLGYFTMEATYRSGIFDMLETLREKFELHLLSGDNDREHTKLSGYFHQLLFRQKPKDKLDYIQQMNQQNHTAMIGDGLNDAGALKVADVGISVVEDLHQFSPACDAILEGKKLNGLQRFLSFSTFSLYVVYAAFTISFLYNIIGISFAVAGYLTPLVSAILMPVSSVTVVGFVTLMINWKAAAKLKHS